MAAHPNRHSDAGVSASDRPTPAQRIGELIRAALQDHPPGHPSDGREVLEIEEVTMTVSKWTAIALIVGGMCAGVLAAAPARADNDPSCNFTHTCSWSPHWNGQLQPTWEVPPYTWPNNQLQCNPTDYSCYPAIRP